MTADELADLIRHRLAQLGVTVAEVASWNGTSAEVLRRWRAGEGLHGHAEFITVLDSIGIEIRVKPTKSWIRPLTRPDI